MYSPFKGFNPGPKPGTFRTCSITNRLDYIFISKALVPQVRRRRYRAPRSLGKSQDQEQDEGLEHLSGN
jgi:hypothetical protein